MLVTALLLVCPAADLAEEVSLVARLRGAESLEQRVARDEALSSPADAADRARRILDTGDAARPLVAAALLTLGSAREVDGLARLAALARDPEENLELRRAAVLGLGEAGGLGFASLDGAHELAQEGLDVHYALALVRSGEAGRRRVIEAAAQGQGELGRAAGLLLDHARGGPPPQPSPAFDLLLELRWRAAREFGLVAGRRWRDLAFEALLADPEFLGRAVLVGSLDLEETALHDHLFQVVVGGGQPGRLRAAAAAMPITLARTIEEGEWKPDGLEEWDALLDAVEERHIEREAVDLLWIAMGESPLRSRAGALLVRAGQVPHATWLEEELKRGDFARVRHLIECVGEGGDPGQLGLLLPYFGEEYPADIEAAAAVALARLDHEPAFEGILARLDEPPGPTRDAYLVALARSAGIRTFQVHLFDALAREDLAPGVRFEIELGLAFEGRLRTRNQLLAWLGDDAPERNKRLVVRALAPRADRREYERMRALFPVEDDLDLNVELALVLLRYRDPLAVRLLHTALWTAPFHESILAGGLLVKIVGLTSLIEALDSPPGNATERHLRRVGFAIGEWGGIPAIETLARRRGADDAALQGAFLGALSTRTR